jgi:iron complex transport system ATP-binding protein
MYVARSIGLRLGTGTILSGVDLSLEPAKVVALVGPNGAGKSSLLKVIAGERPPTAGEILLDGRPLADWTPSALARRRAVLPQAVTLAFPFTVNEVVALGLPPGLTRMEAGVYVDRALDATDMIDLAARRYDELSGGERQRVQLARVLAQAWNAGENSYLLLDEPTTNLDLAHQLLTLRLAREHADGGGGVLIVLHDLNLAAMAADEIVALKGGARIAAGVPAEIMTNDLIAALYGVVAEVGRVPAGPFLLPQTARLPA